MVWNFAVGGQACTSKRKVGFQRSELCLEPSGPATRQLSMRSNKHPPRFTDDSTQHRTSPRNKALLAIVSVAKDLIEPPVSEGTSEGKVQVDQSQHGQVLQMLSWPWKAW